MAVRLSFIGTRGYLKIRSPRHRRHSSLLVEHDRARLMIDCGADWRHLLPSVAPTAIVLTHAHPDHAAGLAGGAPCPVYASRATLKLLRRLPRGLRRVVRHGRPFRIGTLRLTAIPLQHSKRAPTVGFRVTADRRTLFYAPDVAALPNPRRALRGVDLYIGDGASIDRPILRRRGRAWVGHCSIGTQLLWCSVARVGRAIFTHCGSGIVRDKGHGAERLVRQMGTRVAVATRLAHDGLRVVL